MNDQYRKKPITVHAWKITSDLETEIMNGEAPNWVAEAYETGALDREQELGIEWSVVTLEDGKDRRSLHTAQAGAWIIRGITGELYFCQDEIFKETYEPVTATAT